ncbi:MAG: 4Fe-4S dicluster domain-containing protein, partial [Mariniphaga sp.]|nr:4Fe-4S dicluster domain-containing protein [Mariniphaga sp.]
MKLAIIHKDKCKPTICGHECKKYCPVEKKEQDNCVIIGEKAVIDENTCVGCAICVKRCPFGAIDIINLPSVEEKDMVHRYGENGFALYGLPVPKEGFVLGLLGRNGIGKSTAVKLLAGTERINLGSNASEEDIKKFFKGNEILRYFEGLDEKVVSYKPQNLSQLAIDISVMDLLKKRGFKEDIEKLAERLGVS